MGSDPVGGRAGCAPFMRAHCVHNDTLQHSAMMMNAGSAADFKQNLAAFLLVRGPYAWFGDAWKGCNYVPDGPALLHVDYGVPLAHYVEIKPGIFARKWTKANVSLDCRAWEATIKLHAEAPIH